MESKYKELNEEVNSIHENLCDNVEYLSNIDKKLDETITKKCEYNRILESVNYKIEELNQL